MARKANEAFHVDAETAKQVEGIASMCIQVVHNMVTQTVDKVLDDENITLKLKAQAVHTLMRLLAITMVTEASEMLHMTGMPHDNISSATELAMYAGELRALRQDGKLDMEHGNELMHQKLAELKIKYPNADPQSF